MGEAAKGFSSGAAVLALPRRVGRRVLLKLAARGGMGDVYLAATTGIEGAERPCIVKTVRREHVHDNSFLARFLDEARVQAQLNHPGIAQVLEAATGEDGEPYTVVEYVEGHSLSDVRQRSIQSGTKIAWADAVAIAIEVAQALAHVHERSCADGAPLGIVHRDLSPQNVMIGYAGDVKVIDFGTARAHNRRCHTVAGVVFAKPGYVAPEVARQQVGDGRIDLYALGVILWELCAGRRLLSADPQRHLDDVAAGKIAIPPVAQACGAPAEIDQIIAKLTKNDPDERYARASIAVPELARLLASAPPVEGSERGVRARLAAMMRGLWPHEPARARAEFARLLRDARTLLREDLRRVETPVDAGAAHPSEERIRIRDASQLEGTPYRLVRVIGEGASGVVWEAEHVELGRRVALKVLAGEHAASSASLERFRREARALAAVSHPNLVGTLDFGKALDGRVFLAMELVVGETLEARLRGGALGWREATRLAVQACEALGAAHAAGLVHRDIKPENIMLAEGGRLKLLDFGVAAAVSERLERGAGGARGRALQGFAVFGTPEYMAPEQVAGEAIDARTDVYALGCVLYEMLTGASPFEGPSSVVVMGKQLRETPVAPRRRAPAHRITSALDAVVMRAMEKQPSRRFASAWAMRAALEQAIGEPERRRAGVRRIGTAVLMVAAVLAAAGASAQWTLARSARKADFPGEGAPAATTPASPATATAAGRGVDPPPRRDGHGAPRADGEGAQTREELVLPRRAIVARSKR